ncbi:putative galactolipase [Helianthus annuus]|nr:putative galactolipase [Helianthus annuus]KAJ0756675.1 putative galactolipase [Helianthus annuus]KAJ0760424.1 putative galactolipase [Helianthus annuus]
MKGLEENACEYFADLTLIFVLLSIFHQVEKNPMLDAKFSDICIGTSAAPTYLPTHELTIDDAEGKILRKVNLVDGGLFANNPTELAIGEVTRSESTSDYRLLVLSLGTGTQDFEVKYKGARSSHWGIKGWLGGFRSSPILDAYSSSSGYMDEYRGSTLMKLHRSEEMYLRIQDYTLSGDTASMDLATEENLHNLVKVAKDRLKKPVTRRNPDTGELEADPHITNEMALEMYI